MLSQRMGPAGGQYAHYCGPTHAASGPSQCPSGDRMPHSIDACVAGAEMDAIGLWSFGQSWAILDTIDRIPGFCMEFS
jgi:hypothetical protein